MAPGELCKFHAPSQPSAAHKLLVLYIGNFLRHRILRMVFELFCKYRIANYVAIVTDEDEAKTFFTKLKF